MCRLPFVLFWFWGYRFIVFSAWLCCGRTIWVHLFSFDQSRFWKRVQCWGPRSIAKIRPTCERSSVFVSGLEQHGETFDGVLETGSWWLRTRKVSKHRCRRVALRASERMDMPSARICGPGLRPIVVACYWTRRGGPRFEQCSNCSAYVAFQILGAGQASKFKTISLFSGCAGLELGLRSWSGAVGFMVQQSLYCNGVFFLRRVVLMIMIQMMMFMSRAAILPIKVGLVSYDGNRPSCWY